MTAAIHEIRLEMEEARGIVEDGEALTRLSKNPDFKRIVLEGFFKERAVQLVELKAAPAMSSPERQAQILKDLDSIGGLQQYFNSINAMAITAEMTIEAGRAELADEEGGNVH